MRLHYIPQIIHLLAATLSLIIGLLLGANPISIVLGVIILILLCNRIGWSGGILLGIVSIIFILDSPPAAFLIHAKSRMLSIFLGLGDQFVATHY
ncbi:MAG TPA: aromatic acid exporter family protein [Desulfosporosinus sp.]|nr:aromatic acid exporter family protein [Desulfosporosinus sp.]